MLDLLGGAYGDKSIVNDDFVISNNVRQEVTTAQSSTQSSPQSSQQHRFTYDPRNLATFPENRPFGLRRCPPWVAANIGIGI